MTIRTIGFYIMAACLAILVSGCNKQDMTPSPDEIVFNLGGDGMTFDVETKADIVTSVDTVWWEASVQSGVVHKVSKYPVNGGTVRTGHYWPAQGASYTYTVANTSFETGSGLVYVDCSRDIVAGKVRNVSSNDVEVTLDHILARTGTLTLTPPDGYGLRDVHWTVQSSSVNSGLKGSYYIGSYWTNVEKIESPLEITSDADRFFIPGGYLLKVSFTLVRGEYEKAYKKQAEVTFIAGTVNNISGKVTGGGAMEMSFSTKVSEWGVHNINLELRDCDEGM